MEDNERRVSWAVSSLRWYPCKRCTATVLSALCRHPRNRVLNLNDLGWTPIREATIVKQNILACNTDSISQKRSAARALRRRKHPNAKAFLHVNKLLIRLLSNKDEIPFCKLKARGFSCTTESGCLCSRLFEHAFFFAFYTRRCRLCVCKVDLSCNCFLCILKEQYTGISPLALCCSQQIPAFARFWLSLAT